jgi:hypothetical protein
MTCLLTVSMGRLSIAISKVRLNKEIGVQGGVIQQSRLQLSRTTEVGILCAMTYILIFLLYAISSIICGVLHL